MGIWLPQRLSKKLLRPLQHDVCWWVQLQQVSLFAHILPSEDVNFYPTDHWHRAKAAMAILYNPASLVSFATYVMRLSISSVCDRSSLHRWILYRHFLDDQLEIKFDNPGYLFSRENSGVFTCSALKWESECHSVYNTYKVEATNINHDCDEQGGRESSIIVGLPRLTGDGFRRR